MYFICRTIDLDGNSEVSFSEFKQWYLKSETRVMNDVKKAFDTIDVTEDGYVSNANFKEVVNKLGMTEYMTPEAEKNAMHMFTAVSAESKAGFINFEGENDELFRFITQVSLPPPFPDLFFPLPFSTIHYHFSFKNFSFYHFSSSFLFFLSHSYSCFLTTELLFYFLT